MLATGVSSWREHAAIAWTRVQPAGGGAGCVWSDIAAGAGGAVCGAGIASAAGAGTLAGAGGFAAVGDGSGIGAGSATVAGVGSDVGGGDVGVGSGAKTGARRAEDAGIVALIMTGVPVPIADATCNTLQLVRRMQPCDWVLEMRDGSGVPWMPTCGFDRLIQATPTGLFGPGWMVAFGSLRLPSQNSAGL